MPVLNTVDEIYLGSSSVSAVYLDTTKVWPTAEGEWGPNESIFNAPPTGTSPQGAPFTFGFRFTPEVDGRITGVRFYSYFAATNRPVSIWSDAGVKLAHGMGGVEVTTGWQVIPLDTPLLVEAGVPLITSYGWTNSWNVFGYTTATAVSVSPNLTAHKGSYYWGDMDTFPATDGGQHYYADVIFQAAVTSFSPKDVPNLMIWLDATQFTEAEGDAPWWPDSSGNNFTAMSVSAAPVFHLNGINGHPAMRFGENGFTSQRIDHGHTVSDRTVFQVLQTMGSSFGPYHTTQLQELEPYMQTYSAGNVIQTYSNNGSLSSGVQWSGQRQFVTVWCSAVQAKHWLDVDGVQVTSDWTPVATNAAWFIGGFQPGGYASNCFIGEMLIYERCLTDAERGDVLTYLKTKWGL